jgi:ComF family protein
MLGGAAQIGAGEIGRGAVILGLRRGQRAWSADRARCIFSESLNESTLHASPGPCAGLDDGRAGMRTRLTVGERTRSVLRSAFDDLIATTFPSDCRVCGESLLRSSIVPVCELCRVAPRPQTMALCRICGEALDMESARFESQFPVEGLLCHPCRLAPPMFERAVAYAVYQDQLREMVHLLKYEQMRGVAKLLGGQLAEAILTLRSDAARELTVIAVPLFPSKQRQRGYNQAELLADAAIAALRTLDPEWRLQRANGVLTRRRDTVSQFELTPRGRRRNLEGAFAIDGNGLRAGCEVLLIDDIFTSGATARECSRVLRRAGARKVWVATLSRAQAVRVALWESESQRVAQGFG